ncbi:YciI family protein [Herbiconiux sp. CPCC 205763]|uniref:YciI family protein n=1 Tax=Herbiconiux aconitum TaxID=2970913 RepID=A0ABT2GK82_9MICO|nr:YciI family protein [Herbiconiux aconitum]MCS5716526.1 YciI family protein [Herbiconiux aconitum]
MTQEYIILIREPEWDSSAATEEDWAAAMQQHGAFMQAVAAAGAQVLGGDALESSDKAVRITPAHDGSPAVYTDGPFTETKEVVSGFYKICVENEAQARELAALVPTGGWVELFPVMDTNGQANAG